MENVGLNILVAAYYSASNLSGKDHCKQDLLTAMELPVELLHKPLAGMVTRLVDQKGCQLLADAAEQLFAMDMGIVLLGSGEEHYHRPFSRLQAQWPGRQDLWQSGGLGSHDAASHGPGLLLGQSGQRISASI